MLGSSLLDGMRPHTPAGLEPKTLWKIAGKRSHTLSEAQASKKSMLDVTLKASRAARAEVTRAHDAAFHNTDAMLANLNEDRRRQIRALLAFPLRMATKLIEATGTCF